MQKPLGKSEKPLAGKATELVKATAASAFLGTSAIMFNSSQLASTALLPFSKKLFRRYNRWVADTWWGWCVSLAEQLHGVEMVYTGDEIPYKENAIVFSNHQQMTDTTVLMFLGKAKGRLGDMKWFAKDPIKWTPAVGWGMQFIDCIFVKRDWAKDQESISRTFEKYNREEIPMWLVTFTEGTRITPEKHARSMEFARSRGIPETEHVMVPRTEGFVASVKGLREHVKAIYDVTIGYPEGVPTLWQYVKGRLPKAHVDVRRIPVEELPSEDDALTEWMFERYRRKDEILGYFYEHGHFPE